ncbi:hypothetical protein H4R21_002079 [Coemansia helicoidea]|uniref:Uncharacterized protein n=1 Tax=Coemansia helicoidea TaxID=1286919 RepID=A0ACC1L915_9FUNG|nr:hypothetical protein H4R21_002079 [Coemansia helicoidea]
MSALAQEVAEYEAIGDNLPLGPESQVVGLLVSGVIVAGHALLDMQPLVETCQRRAKQYNDLLDQYLLVERPRGSTHGEEALASLTSRLEAVKEERDNTERQYEAAKSEYWEAKREYLNFVRSPARAPQPPGGLGVFSALPVDDSPGESSHKLSTTVYQYSFHRDASPMPLLPTFQVDCQRNPIVDGGRFARAPDAADGREDAFVDQGVAVLGPRVTLVAREMLGLRNVRFTKLHKNVGVDSCITTEDGEDGGTELYLPVEFKRNLPTGNDQPSDMGEPDPNFRANREVLSSFRLGDKRFRPLGLWHAFSQTATYMQYGTPRACFAVLVAKNAVFLLRRVARTLILVSDPIGYTSTDPHPVAAIAFWIRTMKRHPCVPRSPPSPWSPRPTSPQPSHGPPTTRSRSHLGSGNTSPAGGTPLASISGHLSAMRMGSAPGGGASGGGYRGQGSGGQGGARGQQHKARPASSSGSSGLSTAVGAEDTVDMDGWLEHSLLDLDSLVSLSTYRCEMFMGTWGGTRPVVVKAAPVDDEERADEIRNEVAVYRRLRLLQGTDIPRLLAWGSLVLHGRMLVAIVLERIEDRDMINGMARDAPQPVNLDSRAALKELSDVERTACLNALGRVHRLGVVHNDIRGANVLFRDDKAGKHRSPVIIDFGFATVASKQAGKAARKADYTRLLDVFNARSIYQ